MKHIANILFFVATAAAQACERVPLVTPARSETILQRQPMLVWQGTPDRRYRVLVAAVLPEARVIAAHDVEVTGTQFRLPVAIPAERAAVKVVVAHGCDRLGSQDLHAQGPSFFVDMRTTCSLDASAMRIVPEGLEWTPVPGARSYSVRTFEGSAATGEGLVPVAQQTVSEPRVSLTQKRLRTVSVQAVCNGLLGRPVAQVLGG